MMETPAASPDTNVETTGEVSLKITSDNQNLTNGCNPDEPPNKINDIASSEPDSSILDIPTKCIRVQDTLNQDTQKESKKLNCDISETKSEQSEMPDTTESNDVRTSSESTDDQGYGINDKSEPKDEGTTEEKEEGISLDKKEDKTIDDDQTVENTTEDKENDTKEITCSKKEQNTNQDEKEAPNDPINEDEEEKEDEWIFILGHDRLKKKTLRKGDGFSTRPEHGSIVTVSYCGCLDDGTVLDEKKHHVFTLADGDVIQALDLCVALMELHEVCELVTRAQYAYGSKGRDPDIPGGVTLTYTVELLVVESPPDYSMWPIQRRVDTANEKREHGNLLYTRTEYSSAINSYTKALTVIDDSEIVSHNDSAEDLQLLLDTRITCYNNLAAAQLKVEAWDAAMKSCEEVLKKQPDNVKALYRKGKCLSQTGELDVAIGILQKALQLAPDTKIIQQELTRIKTVSKRQDASQRDMYQKMFGGPAKPKVNVTQQDSRWWLYVGGAAAVLISLSIAAYRSLHA